MLIQPDEGKEPYDRFRGRLMFPIRDPRGRVIAFGGRILGDGEPKYLNSPDTPLFDKGRTLYNLDRAGPASRTAKRLIVVEGYMDVIALDRAGIAEVGRAQRHRGHRSASSSGMWRLDPAPICASTATAPGQKAAIRAALRALPHIGPERTLRFVGCPPARTPTTSSAPAAARRSRRCSPGPSRSIERLWRHESRSRAADHARGPRRPQAAPDRACQAIGDPTLRRLYRDEWLNVRRRSAAPQRQPRAAATAPRLEEVQGRPLRPARPARRRAGAGDRRRRHRRATARALIARLRPFPGGIAGPLRAARRASRSPTATAAKLRDQLVDAAFSGATLDRTASPPYWAPTERRALTAARGAMGFSFTRRDRRSGDRARAISAAGDRGAVGRGGDRAGTGRCNRAVEAG